MRCRSNPKITKSQARAMKAVLRAHGYLRKVKARKARKVRRVRRIRRTRR